jgi:uncharacterized repeat protein (TIGR03806 family)
MLKSCGCVTSFCVVFLGGFMSPLWSAERTPWTTSKVVGSPEPPDPYRLELAYPKLKLFEPLSAGLVPGSNRLLVAERPGKIWVFDAADKQPQPHLVADLKRTVYGIAAHPQFGKNGFLFVTSVADPMNPSDKGSRLSRLKVEANKGELKADLKSETTILEWPSGGHNGGCLRFGPEGMLYLATGDGSGIADSLLTGQKINDLLGAILRIDVDKTNGDKLYGIPKNNPFVGDSQAAPEIWSFGHRQVWKYSFDSVTGDLWAGEVGQDLWEMVYLIRRGGNYGWSVREGSHPFRPERPKGPAEFQQPIVEHSHTDFRSITGGWVYHGKRLPELEGAYIYGDYDTGKVWMLKYDVLRKKVLEHRELCDTQVRIVEIIQDADGEILFVDFAGGGLHQLIPVPPSTQPKVPFPSKLSETGLFASVKDHQPTAGVIPYDVIAPLWSDGASKERFMAVPGDGQIEFDSVIYPAPAPGSLPGWRFPDGTVFVKTFSLETEPGNPKSKRRLETRLLHHIKMPGNDDEYGAQVWNGYTYVWNDEQTDAELLEAKGADRIIKIKDKSAPNGVREQKWHFPSRAECTLCHTMAAKYVLGATTAQMNRDFDYGDGKSKNQLRHLSDLGYFTKPLPAKPEEAHPPLADYHDERQSLDARARSYLHANCSHCHRKWGGGNAEFILLASLPLKETGTIGVRPGQGLFELSDPKVLVPGDPARSMVLHRMKKTGLGRMPHIASNVIDTEAVDLIDRWIRALPKEP